MTASEIADLKKREADGERFYGLADVLKAAKKKFGGFSEKTGERAVRDADEQRGYGRRTSSVVDDVAQSANGRGTDPSEVPARVIKRVLPDAGGCE